MARDRYLELLGGELLWMPNRGEAQLYEFVLKGTTAGCLLIVKARLDGKFVVAFFGGGSPEKVLDKAMEAFRKGEVPWKPDKYRD